MKRYIFIMEKDKVAVTMDGAGKGFENVVKTFQNVGYTAKEVTQKEYLEEKQRQEKMMWDRDEQILG